MYVKPGENRPSPGSFSELVEVINTFNLSPSTLVAVIEEGPAEDPFNGPRATVLTITDQEHWGPVEFQTIAFRDRDYLHTMLHAVGIHHHIDADMRPLVAETGPAAGEPDTPLLPIPVPVEPEIIEEPADLVPTGRPAPDDEIIVAAPLAT